MTRASDLVLHIDAAFGPETYPGDEQIVHGDPHDQEAARVKGVLKGWHWRDLPYEAVERLRLALPFLSPAGYRFYLPAFMAMTVADFDRAAAIADEVVRSLTPMDDSDVDRIVALAEAHPEMQPLGEPEWSSLVETMREAYRPGGVAGEMFAERVAGFTAAQKVVIREFLEFLAEVYPDEFPDREPRRALERYWAAVERQ